MEMEDHSFSNNPFRIQDQLTLFVLVWLLVSVPVSLCPSTLRHFPLCGPRWMVLSGRHLKKAPGEGVVFCCLTTRAFQTDSNMATAFSSFGNRRQTPFVEILLAFPGWIPTTSRCALRTLSLPNITTGRIMVPDSVPF